MSRVSVIAPLALAASTLLTGCSMPQKNADINHPSMEPIGRFASGSYFQGAAEIVAWHKSSQSIYVVNASAGTVDILSAKQLDGAALNNPLTDSNLPKVGKIYLQSGVADRALGAVNSIAIHGDLLAVAVEGKNRQENGVVILYRLDPEGGAIFSSVAEVGPLPDMVTFTPDGRFVLTANEGEPSPDYRVDPEGSVSIIAVDEKTLKNVNFATFTEFNQGSRRHLELSEDVRIFGRNATVAQDLEPEYIAISADSTKAFVTLQENNALAIVDIATARVDEIVPMGFKDFGQSEIDASNKDGGIHFEKWAEVYGMYQPDTIVSYQVDGKNYLVTANEGDARDYWYPAQSESECINSGGLQFDEEDGCLGFSEEIRAGKLTLDAGHPHAKDAQDRKKLGRLKVTKTMGDLDNDGVYEQIYSYGARSFSIWSEEGELVYDSGSDFGRITAELLGANFNNNDDKTKGDSRSDDKGGEPEALAVGEIDGRHYAFIGLERTGGVFMYDISDPESAEYIDYINNRDFSKDAQKQVASAGDLSPEGMTFVQGADSPTGAPLLIVGHEVSGTTTVYELQK